MNEMVPVHLTSRGEYDARSGERVKLQKLARNVIYTLMLEIEGDDRQAGRLTVELPHVPILGTGSKDGLAAIDVLFMDDDARPVFEMPGVMKMDQLYLQPNYLHLVNDGRRLREGYFLSNEDEVLMAMQFEEMIGSSHSSSILL